MYRLIWKSKIPRIIKCLLYVLLTITIIYWIIIMAYKLLDLMRRFLHFVSDKKNWWTFVCCVCILLIGTFIVSQFVLGLDPVGKFINSIKEMIDNIRNAIGEAIKG